MYCPDTDRHTSIGNILRERAPETQTNGVTPHRWMLDIRRKRGRPLHHGMLQAVEGAPGSAMPAGRREPAEPADAQSKAVRWEPRSGPNPLILSGLLRQELITLSILSPPIVQSGRWVYTTSQMIASRGESRDLCEEVQVVLDSGIFNRSPALAHLLAYVCEKYFEGTAGQIKEYSVAIDVLRRPAEFDPKRDSIIRVQFHRLRARLLEYYAHQGANQAVQIVIPQGQYAPRFIIRGDTLSQWSPESNGTSEDRILNDPEPIAASSPAPLASPGGPAVPDPNAREHAVLDAPAISRPAQLEHSPSAARLVWAGLVVAGLMVSGGLWMVLHSRPDERKAS